MQGVDTLFDNFYFPEYNILLYLKEKEQPSSICSNLPTPSSPTAAQSPDVESLANSCG